MLKYGSWIRRGAIAVISLVYLMISPQWGRCEDQRQIIEWVAAKMQIKRAYSMPAINIVGKSELNKVFVHGNERVMARWVADHGRDKADKIMNVYLESAVGLFDPKTSNIYVGDFLPTCRQEAILAHEFTHYFQYLVQGPVSGGGMAAEMLLMEREIEACAVERSYEERFCNDLEAALYIETISDKEPIYFP